MQESENYQLEKTIWTEKDFSQMGWHDSLIHGFASAILDENEPWKNELYFDIDYIFKWVDPKPPNSFFTFWVAPCTLVFKNYYDLKIEADLGYSQYFEIADLNLIEEIKNENNNLKYFSWEIELQGGSISLKSESYEQIVRKKPIHSEGQWLNLDEREGLSFSKVAFESQ